MDHIFDSFHWLHGGVFAAFALIHLWAWKRGGFWVPRYVHVIALTALIAGAAVTLALPRPTNPDPMVQWSFPIILPVLFVVAAYSIAILLGFVDIARREKLKRMKTTNVRIIASPPGAAPEEIRQAWVGLVLALAPGEYGPREVHGVGAKSTVRLFISVLWTFAMPGRQGALWYVVSVDEAMCALDKARPDAAHWWKQNRSRVIGSDDLFLFPINVCQAIP